MRANVAEKVESSIDIGGGIGQDDFVMELATTIRPELRSVFDRIAAVCERSQMVGEYRRGNLHAEVLEAVVQCPEVQAKSADDFFGVRMVKTVDAEIDKLVAEGALSRDGDSVLFAGTKVKLVLHVTGKAAFVTKVVRLSYTKSYAVEIESACLVKGYRWLDTGFMRKQKTKVSAGPELYLPKDCQDFFAFIGMSYVDPKDVPRTKMAAAGFTRFVEDHTWKAATAKEYEKWPHSYIIREWSRDVQRFTDAVRFIRDNGEERAWFHTRLIYYVTGGKKYWTMVGPATVVGINRAVEA